MTGWFEVVVVAFVAQLTVLPGEKVQFIIAGLSTRYHPLLVVSAAGSAFAGWTAVEILVGEALQRALPGVALAAMTAGMFLLFAVLLYRSAPPPERSPTATDGGLADAETEVDPDAAVDGQVDADEELDVRIPLVDVRVPNRLGGFLPIFAMMAVGEFGDKTQLITITLAAQYGATSAIWVGEMLAIIPVSLVNAYFFHRFSHRFDLRRAHFVAAGLFAFFGLDTVLQIATGFSVWEEIIGAVSTVVLALVGVVA